jgi:hypothetical protein
MCMVRESRDGRRLLLWVTQVIQETEDLTQVVPLLRDKAKILIIYFRSQTCDLTKQYLNDIMHYFISSLYKP